MDEFSINFGRHRIMGCPWHGLVRGSRLTLPNGQHKDGQWFATTVRGSYRVAVPGVAPIARTAEEAAYDAEQGYQWRTDAVINLWSNDAALMLYGRKNIQASTLYAEAVGNCWAVALPSNMAVNAGKTQLQQPAVFGRFGALSFAPVEDERPVTVTLAGYDPADPQDRPNPSGRTWDSLPDGSQTILGGAGYGATHDLYVPTAGFDLLRVSGKGTPESPFAAVLEKLSSAASGSVTQTDTFQTWSGVTDWVPQITEEWIAPLDSESGGCEWLKVTVSGSTLELDPDGIPSAVTPALTYTSGVREAKLLDSVIGWWFLDGALQPVTMDIEYKLTATFETQGGSVGTVPQVRISKYAPGGGGCAPVSAANGGSYSFEPGVFTFSGTTVRSTTERLIRRLKVGGTLIDTAELVYEDINTRVLSGSENSSAEEAYRYNLVSGMPGVEVDSVWTRRLLVDGVEIDGDTVAESGDTIGFGLNGFSPVRAIDSSNRFAGGDPVTYWLPLLTGGSLPPDIATLKWFCNPQWLSNHLVCLLRQQAPYAGSSGRSFIYGATAYPGGVSAGQISSPAPSPGLSAPPLYGAHDPLTGAVLLGQSEKVTFV